MGTLFGCFWRNYFGLWTLCELDKIKEMQNRLIQLSNSIQLFNRNALFICLVLLFVGCSNSKQPDPLLEEANEYHLKAMAVYKEVVEKIEKETIDSTALAQLQDRLKTWDNNLIEVPGFEHTHDHGHDHDHDDHDHDHEGHDHDHGAPVKVTPEHMRNIQKEFLDSIQVIQKDLEVFIQSGK